jgi:hypothetical protein
MGDEDVRARLRRTARRHATLPDDTPYGDATLGQADGAWYLAVAVDGSEGVPGRHLDRVAPTGPGDEDAPWLRLRRHTLDAHPHGEGRVARLDGGGYPGRGRRRAPSRT